jgi:hypothetical protein
MRIQTRHLCVAAGVIVAAACGTKEAAGPITSDPAGRIRFVNVIMDPTKVPVNAILESVPFGVSLAYTASTPASLPSPSTANYSAILAGIRTLVLKRTADTTVTVATFPLTITANQDKTVYATGGASALNEPLIVAFETVDDNAAATSTTTKLRIMNLSPTAGSVDVFVTAAGADLTTATPVASGLAYKAPPSTYFTVAPGTYVVRFVPAGTPAGARNASVIITSASTAFAGGTGRTVVSADGPSGGGTLRAFVLTDQ